MVTAVLRKSGNSYVVTIPREEIERQQLKEGDTLAVEVTPVEIRPRMREDVRKAFEESWKRNEEGLRYLADR